MYCLRADHLNQQVVVTGGYNGGDRDEVFFDFDFDFACLQVLQYNPSNNTWSQIGALQTARHMHAIAAFGCNGMCEGFKFNAFGERKELSQIRCCIFSITRCSRSNAGHLQY